MFFPLLVTLLLLSPFSIPGRPQNWIRLSNLGFSYENFFFVWLSGEIGSKRHHRDFWREERFLNSSPESKYRNAGWEV